MALEGPVRPIAAAALCLALLTGCGESERDRVRERVDAYISGERAVMQRAEPEFRRANETFLAYARGEISHADAALDAERAVQSIGAARDSVSALDPPAEAQDLHDGLVGYLQLNVDVARETERLAEYVPAADRAARRLTRANRALQDRLAGAGERQAQTHALDRFQAAVGATLDGLRALDPPAVLEPAHEDQERQLAQTRRLAAALHRALAEQNAERVARLLRRFRANAARERTPRLAARQALAQYARRLQQLTDAYGDVRREQTELARELS